MKRLTTLTGLIILALFIGVTGTTLRPDTAEARPTDVISFNQDVCFSLVSDPLGEVEAAAICYPGGSGGLYDSPHLQALASQIGGYVDDPDTYETLVAASGAQLGKDSSPDPGGGALWVLTFVTNDENLHLDADEGVWLSTGLNSSQTDCPFNDADCDNNISTVGDGVVVDMLVGNGVADIGGAIVTAAQSGIDVEMDYTVLGAAPAGMTLSADPPVMVCDGSNSSTVTATLRDSLGNLVADGTPVHFSVQGPAVVNPIWAWTIDGVASTIVTGLSGITFMLPVYVTSGDLEASIGVACTAPPPPPPVGDVNCDGQVSMVDAMLIAQKVAGLIDEFPCVPPPTPTPGP